MRFLEGVRVAARSLWAYKLRTSLTILGNVVAVTSVIAVVSLIDGMDRFVRTEIAEEGSNVLTLRRVDLLKSQTDFQYLLDSRVHPDVTLSDYRYLREHPLESVERVAAFDHTEAVVDHEGRGAQNVTLYGWTADYPLFHDFSLEAGRHFSFFEERSSGSVAVLGADIAEKILGAGNPIGKTLRINGRHVEVIGVLAKQKSVLGRDPNRVVIVPLLRYFKIVGARSIGVRFRVAELGSLEASQQEIRQVMRIRRGLKPSEEDNFAVTSSEQIVALWEAVSRAIFTALILLVSISLVVGGVVIMNIMLVSVTERIREVGTRKALGARRSDILWQFLVESITISIAGGAVGILLGFGAASMISLLTPLPYAVEPWSIAAGLFVTLLVGLFFGIYPANRAAGLDPVEALRYE
jgi:putative ABC transport system permease protein